MHLAMAAPAKALQVRRVQRLAALRYLSLVVHQLSSRHPALSLALLTERMACSVPVPHSSPLGRSVESMPGRTGGVVSSLVVLVSL